MFVSIVDSDQVNASCIPLGLFFNLLKQMEIVSGVATNSGLVGSGDDKGGRGRFKSGPFLYRKYQGGMKESNVFLSCQ